MRQLANGAPDIIMVDYHLDETTGIELYRSLERELGQAVHGFLITADRSEEVKELAASCDLVLLNKPVKPAALRALLAQRSFSTQAAE